MTDPEQSSEDRLNDLSRQMTELSERCHFRTLLRIADEARRLARSEQQLIPYFTAGFHVMNDSRNLLRPAQGREMAIELIALLESEDRARQFQPDLPEEEYERTRWWLTACSYDNLAVSTAESNGYNSEGMHQCIAEGIQVCRRTGKLRCISCFREYATNVYLAADDLDMALHHARVGIHNTDPGPHDRRHIGAKDCARILVLQGQLDAALDVLHEAWDLAEVYHSPYAGRLDTWCRAAELFHLAGCPERLDQLPRIVSAEAGVGLTSSAEVLVEPPRDEFPSHFLDRDLAEAFVACCGSEWERALALLQPWDKQLRELDGLSRWFEVRLRLVALFRLWGKRSRAESLAAPLREAAERARDWLTVRRLNPLLEDSRSVTPLALVGRVVRGPFAETVQIAVGDIPATPQPEAAPAQSPAAAELSPRMKALRERIDAALGDSSGLAAILRDVLTWNPRDLEPREAIGLLQLLRFFAAESVTIAGVWEWAQEVADTHPLDATVQSLLASFGARWRSQAESENGVVTAERLDALFRRSLDLDPHSGPNFARAGTYYLDSGNLGEAERCLARAFRFLRTTGTVVRQLADVYRQTDRPRDAIAVLDLALREGCVDPDVAWEAGLTSLHQDQFDAALTYLDRYETLNPDQPWTNYYRASGLLELQRPDEALGALARESKCNPDQPFPVTVLRGSALAALKREDEFREQLERILSVPLYGLTSLTLQGLLRMMTRLWKSTAELLPLEDPDRVRLETRLLESGLAPNELFAAHRDVREAVPGVNFYQCVIHQPLDRDWRTFAGCLSWEQDWTAYENTWGVLAVDEDSARRDVLAWQQRCYGLEPEILRIVEDDSGYTDAPGVVWQGYRESGGVASNDGVQED